MNILGVASLVSIDRLPGKRGLRYLCTLFLLSGLPCFLSAVQSRDTCELYSWEKGNEWYYTLVAGQDRSRDALEIRWSAGRVRGIYPLKEKIFDLPAGTKVHWREMDDRGLVLPPPPIVADLTKYAASVGVAIVVHPSPPSSHPHPKKD